MQLPAPVREDDPAGQGKQTVPPRENRPAVQFVHPEDPAALDCPAVQFVHDVDVKEPVYRPAGHGVQEVDPRVPAYWPGLHGGQLPNGTLEALPTGHGVQEELKVGENCPAAH